MPEPGARIAVAGGDQPSEAPTPQKRRPRPRPQPGYRLAESTSRPAERRKDRRIPLKLRDGIDVVPLQLAFNDPRTDGGSGGPTAACPTDHNVIRLRAAPPSSAIPPLDPLSGNHRQAFGAQSCTNLPLIGQPTPGHPARARLGERRFTRRQQPGSSDDHRATTATTTSIFPPTVHSFCLDTCPDIIHLPTPTVKRALPHSSHSWSPSLMLPAIAAAQTTVAMTTAGFHFQCPVAYTAGATVGESEAAVLQALIERHLRGSIRRFIAAEQAAGRAPTTDSLREAAWHAFEDFDFGAKPRKAQRRTGGDPILRRAREIAKATVRAHIKNVLQRDPRDFDIKKGVEDYLVQHGERVMQMARDALAQEEAVAQMALSPVAQGAQGAQGTSTSQPPEPPAPQPAPPAPPAPLPPAAAPNSLWPAPPPPPAGA